MAWIKNQLGPLIVDITLQEYVGTLRAMVNGFFIGEEGFQEVLTEIFKQFFN